MYLFTYQSPTTVPISRTKTSNMKSVILMYCFILFLISPAISQDILIKNDKSKLEVKVEQIKQDEITYRKYSNLNGPLYIMPKSEIFLIIYENGEQEHFGDYAGSTSNEKEENVEKEAELLHFEKRAFSKRLYFTKKYDNKEGEYEYTKISRSEFASILKEVDPENYHDFKRTSGFYLFGNAVGTIGALISIPMMLAGVSIDDSTLTWSGVIISIISSLFGRAFTWPSIRKTVRIVERHNTTLLN